MPQDTLYKVTVTNQADGDGHYCARIYLDGDAVPTKHFYDEQRDAVVSAARGWVARHRAWDPDDIETIDLGAS